MKKVTSLLLIMALVLTLSACGFNRQPEDPIEESTQESTTLDLSKPVFMLESLPEIGEFSQKNLYKRWYEEYTDELRPRSDYGELIPFIGDCRYYEETEYYSDRPYGFYSSRYGLMTTDGKIVVDAVYEDVNEMEIDGEIYYTLTKSIPYETEDGWYNSVTETTVAKRDGSRAFNVSGYTYMGSNGRIVASGGEYGENLTVYDYSGNLIFKIPSDYNVIGGYQDGLLCATNYNLEYPHTNVYDVDGNVAFEVDGEVRESFSNGYAVIGILMDTVDYNYRYGIIDTKGSWAVRPIYEDIQPLEGTGFSVTGFGKTEILDENLKSIRKTDKKENWYEVVGNRLVYHINGYYFDALTDEPIVCKKNGLQATNILFETDRFYVKDGSSFYIFDTDGKLLITLPTAEDIFELGETMLYTVSREESFCTERYYDFSGKKLLELNYDYETGYESVLYPERESKFLVIISSIGDDPNEYRIFDREKGEYLEQVFNFCRDIKLSEAGGKLFISLAYDDHVCVYDEDMNMIFKASNQYTD